MKIEKITMQQEYDFLKGATLLVDKPLEWTSFDVVNKLRFALRKTLKIKKIKVGHAGTLDPLATGLLIICTGKATKTIEGIQGQFKRYTGTIHLGATTPSYDAETEVQQGGPIDHLTEVDLEQARLQFLGTIDQKPPIFSAIKVKGQRLYKKARKGEKVKIKSREVTIHDFQITKIDLPEVEFAVKCSKGTYIRSLAHDFGQVLGCGAYLSGLRRTHIGEYSIDDAWALTDLVEHIQQNYEPIQKS